MTRVGRLVLLGVGLACAFAFASLTWLVSTGILEVLDAQLSVAVRSLRTPALNTLMHAVTFTGGWLFVAAATLGLGAFLLARTRRADATTVVIVVVGGAALSWAAKLLVGRVRPPAESALAPLPGSEAFPSGHTMAAACLAAALVVALCCRNLRWRNLAFALIAIYPAAVAFSRVYLGVHWPSDVLAAGALAGAWSALVIGASATWRGGSARVNVEPLPGSDVS